MQGFLDEVHSGRNPDAADRYLAAMVQAHQLTSEGETTVVRSPRDYADHMREFLATYGHFSVHVEDIIAQGDRVVVRWRQDGTHLGPVNGEKPTGGALSEIAVAIYRVSEGRIAEYWILQDRKGVEIQLQKLAGEMRGSRQPM